MRNYMIILILLVPAVGCAPATIQGLRDDPVGKYEFTANENYQSVYRKVLYPARNCFPPPVVRGDLFQDLKSGNVTIAAYGFLGVDTFLTIDVFALDDKTTNVVVYHGNSAFGSIARAVREWVLDNSTECRSKKE